MSRPLTRVWVDGRLVRWTGTYDTVPGHYFCGRRIMTWRERLAWLILRRVPTL